MDIDLNTALIFGPNLRWTEHSSNDLLFSQLSDKTEIRQRLWKCYRLWATRPNSYDRSVGATRLFRFDDGDSKVESLLKVLTIDKEKAIDVECLLRTLKAIPGLKDDNDRAFGPNVASGSFLVRVTFPKGVKSSGVSLCLFHIDINQDTLSCFTPGNPEKSYRLSFDGAQSKVTAQILAGVSTDSTMDNLLSRFFTKAIVWSRTEPSNTPGIASLALVGEDAYLSTYRCFKMKYGESLRRMWTECTNPEKFIYEDIAIASYLNLLWEPSSTFVDLGCGNGLLVYILTAEGHRGVGLDVRARKIWAQYPHPTQLQVHTINPSNCEFPETDWIIGNHSDELTPWVPVIAAKSSFKTQFFLLPCCPYEFSGEKYKRSNTSKSQYSDYMDYVEWICVQCGFNVYRDRLKIPSTKRLCFVSRGRLYGRDELATYREKITEMVKNGGKQVKIRESIEPVRNCTKLNRNLVTEIVHEVSTLVLRSRPVTEHSISDWNEGEFVDLSRIALSLGMDLLRQLKNECGGLQTLLRNHRFVFRVESGRVKFRRPRVLSIRPSRWKVAPCWFYRNHPQSCPLSDEECSFIHD